MKKISTLIIGLSLIASSALYADNNDHTGNHIHEGKMANHEKEAAAMSSMDHGKMMSNTDMKNKNMSAYHEKMLVDGYHVTLSSMKPLTDGKNHMSIILKKGNKTITNAAVKIKFDMPMMPGMDFSEKAMIDGDKYNSMVDFSMGGKWNYDLDFKTSDGKMHKAKGSVNF